MITTRQLVLSSFIPIFLVTAANILIMIMQMTPVNAQPPVTIVRARVLLAGNVSGVLDLTESSNQTGVSFVGKVTGLTPGKHGFHIHQFGDMLTQEQCLSMGAHYNPANATHGAQSSGSGNRHAGDLGNIEANADGVANVDIVDRLVSLIPNSPIGNNIMGRSIVVHALEDDLGQGGDSGSMTTGNAGARLACGIIGLVSEEGVTNQASGVKHVEITTMTVAFILVTSVALKNVFLV